MPRCDERRLAEERLPVAPSFTGDQPFGAIERRIETNEIGDDFRAGAKLAAEKEKREPQPARGARARPIRRAAMKRTFRERSEAREGRVDGSDRVGSHTLLRTEDRGRTALAA